MNRQKHSGARLQVTTNPWVPGIRVWHPNCCQKGHEVSLRAYSIPGDETQIVASPSEQSPGGSKRTPGLFFCFRLAVPPDLFSNGAVARRRRLPGTVDFFNRGQACLAPACAKAWRPRYIRFMVAAPLAPIVPAFRQGC